jgi:acylphosphatase
MDSCVKVIVAGLVQGVGFRWLVERTARNMGIRGWVKNRLDGSVEIEAEGSESELQALIKEVHIGPRSASVKGVNVEWKPYAGKYNSFEITF